MKTIAISDLHGLLPEIVEPADIMLFVEILVPCIFSLISQKCGSG